MMDSGPPPQAASTAQQRQRQRIGQEYPYRDDPMAPPSVRLESYTPGGLGPLHADSMEKSKELPLSRQILNTAIDVCRPCCAPQEPRDTDDAYIDTFNELPWGFHVGTSDEDGIWLNRGDPAGTVMAAMVWLLLVYSAFTMTTLARTGGIPPFLAMVYTVLTTLALACHVKTTLTDPGSIPTCAVPTAEQRQDRAKLTMCSQCQTFKPPHSHHCRICNRCVSRMDHHCPWMNNCIGAGNLKHFCLFLGYCWTCSLFALLLFSWNYFFCADESCEFSPVMRWLVWLMSFIGLGSFLFTSSMLMNVVYGIMTGIGTIDRLKKKSIGTMDTSDEEPIPLSHVFGIDPMYMWFLPTDPLFPDYDKVFGYATPQRLLREQMLRNAEAASVVSRDSWGMAI